jgi:hypothetical protein
VIAALHVFVGRSYRNIRASPTVEQIRRVYSLIQAPLHNKKDTSMYIGIGTIILIIVLVLLFR